MESGYQGTASRRRPSVDWPMSREEKKYQALQLYEQDVQTCNQMLKSKDKALRAAKDEIKELRRQSTASTEEIKELRRMSTASTGTGGHSTSDADSENRSPLVQPTDEELKESQVEVWPEELESNAEQPPKTSADPHPTSRRSSSLEVVSSWLAPSWQKDQEEQSSQTRRQQQRTASPRRMRRSNSLETASSWWAPAWKAVRSGARRATESATETARILADEARILADEARDILPVLGGDARNQESGAVNAVQAPNAKPATRPGPAQFMEWRVDLEPDGESAGLKLEPYVAGRLRRVHSVTQGLAVDEWNSCKAPVTVFLQPGSRERITRMVVRPGDELIAVDEKEVEPTVEEVDGCRTMTFRRHVVRRAVGEDGGA